MKIEVIIHNVEKEEGGFWAEIPSIKGCYIQGETYDEIFQFIHKAIELNLSSNITEHYYELHSKIVQIWI